MNINTTIRKTLMMWVFLCLMLGVSGSMSATIKETGTGTFAKPDFAFPVDVNTEARTVLKRAMVNGNSVEAIRAAMQISIASNLISQADAPNRILLFDTLANRLPKPYSDLAMLLEASLYKDIYNSKSRIFNQRVLPPTPVPENPLEWDRSMFVSKITSLVKEATTPHKQASQMPIKDIAMILTDYEQGIKAGLKVEDFILIEGYDLISDISEYRPSGIPFFAKDNEIYLQSTQCKDLKNNLLSRLMKMGENVTERGAMLSEYCLELMSGNDYKQYLSNSIKRFRETEWCLSFLIRKANMSGSAYELRSVVSEIENYLRNYPNAVNAEEAKAFIKDKKLPVISFNAPGQILPSSPLKIGYEVSNLSNFHLLLVKMPDKYLYEACKDTNIVNEGSITRDILINLSDSVAPFSYKGNYDIKINDPGVYAIIASKDQFIKGRITDKRQNVSLTLVSSLTTMQVDPKSKEPGYIIVADGKNQKPVSEAEALFYSTYPKNQFKFKRVTDKEGMITQREGSYDVRIRNGKEIAKCSSSHYPNTKDNGDKFRVNVFTDLAIYHPGDSIGFSAIFYSEHDKELKPIGNNKVIVWIRDVNNQSRYVTVLQCDNFGRVSGRLKIPTDGLLGDWRIEVNSRGKESTSGSAYFRVEEYKAPKFQVVVTTPEKELKAGSPLEITGEVRTYSGMPIGNAEVKYEIRYVPVYWRMSGGTENASYGGEVKTSSDGSFMISLPTEGLIGTPYAFGRYEVQISATTGDGETQMADPLYLSMGKAYRIDPNIPQYYNTEKPEELRVTIYDMADHPVKSELWYRITSKRDSTISAEGYFMVPEFKLPTLSPGEYTVEFSLSSEFKATDEAQPVKSSIIVYNDHLSAPPVQTSIWLPETRMIVPEGEKKVRIRIGSSYPGSYILMTRFDSSGKPHVKWIRMSKGMEWIETDAPNDKERVRISFAGMHDLNVEKATILLVPEIQTRNLEIKTETFRDQIVPGSKENWKFKLLFKDAPQVGIPVMAVMTDKALNALEPFSWQFNPYASVYRDPSGYLQVMRFGSSRWSINVGNYEYKGIKADSIPEWELYGHNLYGKYNYNRRNIRRGVYDDDRFMAVYPQSLEGSDGISIRGSAKRMASMKMANDMAGGMNTEETSDEAQVTGAPGADVEENGDIEYRDQECPIAFFRPTLLTDSLGVATIDFTVPDFNGTWQLQVLGYMPDGMRGKVIKLESKASKPVMVSLNAPRFLRVGDETMFATVMYNNSSNARELTGKIEIFDPLTGKIFYTGSPYRTSVEAMGSSTWNAGWKVPGGIMNVGIRVSASGADHTDGEQVIVPILPSSTPVVEAWNFYLSPGQHGWTANVATPGENSVNTLVYSDNPIWDCFLALPDLVYPVSENALALSNAYFGNAMTAGLMKKFPRLEEALRMMADPANAGDSTLVSNLEKNAKLKTVALINTPWVRDAASETLRMSMLKQYLDKSYTNAMINKSLTQLRKLQKNSGGWCWVSKIEESRFITEEVVADLAALRRSGFASPEVDEMAVKGIKYIDKVVVADYNKKPSVLGSIPGLASYFINRRIFVRETTGTMEMIRQEVLKKIQENWRGYSIYDKATAALFLHNEGYEKQSKEILRSLRQYAKVSKEKGMWFDNLKSRWSPVGPVSITGRVLRAYSSIDPEAPEVDQLRQWLLMEKQTQNWGTGRSVTEVVSTILETGTDWTKQLTPPEIMIDGKKAEISKIATLTGKIVLDLGPEARSVEVHRDGVAPAWGGIISQFEAPLLKVKPAGSGEITVNKNVYIIHVDREGSSASDNIYHQGDKVRITLTIKSDRNLQYVAITDSRAACLEPVDQLSHYYQSDGVWMYKEIRNTATNLFIPYLPKGTFVISYDCYVDRKGAYGLGIATVQSQYAPTVTAHSGGNIIKVSGN